MASQKFEILLNFNLLRFQNNIFKKVKIIGINASVDTLNGSLDNHILKSKIFLIIYIFFYMGFICEMNTKFEFAIFAYFVFRRILEKVPI